VAAAAAAAAAAAHLSSSCTPTTSSYYLQTALLPWTHIKHALKGDNTWQNSIQTLSYFTHRFSACGPISSCLINEAARLRVCSAAQREFNMHEMWTLCRRRYLQPHRE
jgi:hypothetical protein